MHILERLNAIRAFQRTHMSYLESLEDFDLVCEIGTAQQTGTVLLAKHLVEGHMGAPATIRRRLERLVTLGIVTKTTGKDDLRTAPLHLSREALKAYGKLEKHMEQLKNR